MTSPIVSIEQFLAPWLQVFHTVTKGFMVQHETDPDIEHSFYASFAELIIDTALTEKIGGKDEVLNAIDVLLDDLTVSYRDNENKLSPGFGAAYLNNDFWESPTGVVIFRALRRILGDELMIIDQAADQFDMKNDQVYYLVRKNLLPTYLDTVGTRIVSMYVRFDHLQVLDVEKEEA